MRNKRGKNNHSNNLMSIHKFIIGSKISTTSEVAKEFNLSWNTAEKRLLELVIEGKIEKIKKEGVNLWIEKK